MTKDQPKNSTQCCAPNTGSAFPSCCTIEALVPVDARGQVVLPKDLREKAGIEAGEKFAVVSFEREGKVCCIALVKASDFADSLREMLGPMMTEIFRE